MATGKSRCKIRIARYCRGNTSNRKILIDDLASSSHSPPATISQFQAFSLFRCDAPLSYPHYYYPLLIIHYPFLYIARSRSKTSQFFLTFVTSGYSVSRCHCSCCTPGTDHSLWSSWSPASCEYQFAPTQTDRQQIRQSNCLLRDMPSPPAKQELPFLSRHLLDVALVLTTYYHCCCY